MTSRTYAALAQKINPCLFAHRFSDGLYVWDSDRAGHRGPDVLVGPEPDPHFTYTQAWKLAYERLFTTHIHLSTRR